MLTPNPAPGTDFALTVNCGGGNPSVDVQIAGTAFITNSVIDDDGNPMHATFIDKTLLVVTVLGAQLNPAFHRMYVFNPVLGGGISIVDFTVMERAQTKPRPSTPVPIRPSLCRVQPT